MYWSNNGKYDAIIRVVHPTNNDPLVMSAKDAFIVFLYVYNKSLGTTLVNIPTLLANCIRKTTNSNF